MGLISLKNPAFQEFEPIGVAPLHPRDFLLQSRLLRDERVLQLLELGKFKGTVCEGGIDAVDLRLEREKLGLQPVEVLPFGFRGFALPDFDFGEEAFLPFLGNGNEFNVALHFRYELFLADEASVGTGRILGLVGASVVEEAEAALLDVAFAGHGVATGTASGEVEEEEALVASTLAGLGDGNEGLLHGVEDGFGDHGKVDALVHLPFMVEYAVVEWIAEEVADGRERERFAAPFADESGLRHFPLNAGQGVFASGELFENPLHFGKTFRVRFNGAKFGFVHVPERGFPIVDAAAHFFPDAPADVHREVADVLIGHAEFNRNHEHVVARQIRFLERADFLDDAALKQADDLSAVVKITGETVELPGQDGVGLPLLDAANHLVEDRPAGLLGTLAFRERLRDHKPFSRSNFAHLGKLRVDREHLAVFVFGGFPAIHEVFIHGHSIACDIYYCEHKMKKTETISKKDLFLALHGDSERDRLLHRLHCVVLVSHGLSAVEVAGIFGDSPRAVSYWVTRFKKRGFDGLGEEKSPGRPSKLTAAQITKVERFVAESLMGAKPLTGEKLASFVKKEFGVSITIRQCWRILKRLRT